jgi:hypothetical protein
MVSTRPHFSPEPGDEKHHLGGDEQDHAVAVRNLHHAGVEALVFGFANYFAPPADHRVEHADDADAEHGGRSGIHMMHPADEAHRQDESRDGADRRPRARRDQVVIVMLGVGVGHRLRLRSGPGDPRPIPY